jgi:hypothetical protein
LLYVKGWPKGLLTASEAELFAGVRREKASIMDFDLKYLTAGSVVSRHEGSWRVVESPVTDLSNTYITVPVGGVGWLRIIG